MCTQVRMFGTERFLRTSSAKTGTVLNVRELVTLELIHLRTVSRDINSLALPACPEDGHARPRVR